MRILVLGGNGFLGRQICREALSRGSQVYSLNRSGPPKLNSDQSMHKVVWLKGDASELNSYPKERPDIIIHCIGTLFEGKNTTYRHASYDTALTMLKYCEGHKTIIGYASADDISRLGQWILPNYFLWKRRAEEEIKIQAEKAIIIRPGLIMGRERPLTLIIGWIYNMVAFVSGGLLPLARTSKYISQSLLDALDKAQGIKTIQGKDI